MVNPKKANPAEYPILPFESKQAWAKWLGKHHNQADGIWLKFAKKNSGIPSLNYDEAVDVALCYGWIDGQMKGLDDKYWLQKFTPRRPKSLWSKINTEKAQRLIASGEMRPAGLEAIEAAKQDGRWEAAYSSQKNMTVPEDFQSALKKNKKAKAFFATLSGANRYAILFRIETAKRAETRARRIQQFVDMLERGEKLAL
ncbi:MAG: YdeI/OmpD-associated family protein [Chloroflexota bacterium]|nr:YdeI/OmpD-associated family protein [Chloroflexota bacterium]